MIPWRHQTLQRRDNRAIKGVGVSATFSPASPQILDAWRPATSDLVPLAAQMGHVSVWLTAADAAVAGDVGGKFATAVFR